MNGSEKTRMAVAKTGARGRSPFEKAVEFPLRLAALDGL